jgi:hypothetical protein
MHLANAVGDWTVPLTQAKAAVIYATEGYFANEQDPEGDPWKELNADYLDTKLEEGYPPNILHRTGTMEDVATDEDSWHITDRDIYFETERLPFYGPYHQFAPSKDPDQGLPRREFIGISDECADEIQAIFTNFIDRRVADNITRRRRVSPPIPTFPAFGEAVYTTKGIRGILTNVPAIGGGFLVRGESGRFVKGIFNII